MEITVSFPGKMRATATVGEVTIETDQSVSNGGEGVAPEPFDLFLVLIATCAGSYALSFMKARDIDAEGSRIVMTVERDERTRLVTDLGLTLHLPEGFPEKVPRGGAARHGQVHGEALPSRPADDLGRDGGAHLIGAGPRPAH